MSELKPFLKELMTVSGLSGFEAPAADLIKKQWQPLVDEVSFSRLGSLHGLKRGSGTEPRPSVLIAAHMDAIGLMVTHLVDGFLRITAIGGVDVRVLPGQPVWVHATGAASAEALPGIIVQPPARLLDPDSGSGPVGFDGLFVDTGLSPKKVRELVRVGDLVSFATEPMELAGEMLAGHSLDNRASVAALTVALQELKQRSHAWDVLAVATVQEETGLLGAFTSAFDLRPDIAIAVDVTFAKGPGSNDWQTFNMDKGAVLGWGPNIHPFIHRKVKEVAEQNELPYTIEILPRHSGTDAFALQVVAEGIPSMTVSIPLRYMHTPVEVVAVRDIQRTGRLLAAFIASLSPDFIDTIVWE